ncbi:MAG: gliding motility-associated C-terminal domain-containing protein [Saprospiraceae bacterium]|nr:gliding motility-associated C-terminal domain-containing protein [Saprospiraceae bacterium]
MLFPFLLSAQDLTLTFDHQADGAFMVEGCAEIADTLVFARTLTNDSITYNFLLQGSATAGVDYTIGTTELTFIPGQSELRIPISAISDNMAEDRETISIIVIDETGNRLLNLNILILDGLEVVIEPDMIEVCQGESVNLSAVIPGEYLWVVGNDTLIGSQISFISSEEMTVKVFTSLGDCQAEDEILINLRTGITFNVVDTAYVCLGEQANITVDIIGNPTGDYIWSPLDSTLTVLADQSIQVNTNETRTYYLMFTNSDCEVLDSVVVRVDSLPDLPISIIPEKETYCPGEKVTLFSRYLYPPDFPDVEFKWVYDAGGPLSADTLQNFTFTTEDTSYFRLTATNNACTVTDSVLLIVINPPVNLSVTDTTVCPNQPVKVVLLNAAQFDEIMWSPETGISCTDCADPTIRVSESMTFTVTGMSMGCPASGSVNVNIFPPEVIPIDPDTTVCPGEPVRLFSPDVVLSEDLEWSGQALDCSKCDSPVASPSQTTAYQVMGTKPDGCLGIGGVVVQTYPTPNAFVSATPPGPVEIGTTISLTSGLPESNTFKWSVNGQMIEGNATSIDATVIAEGDNVFKVEVTSLQGCMGMGQTIVVGNPPKYEIPNAFTPNGDQMNDSFKVLIFGNIELMEFKIFNRWGQVVFEGTGENGWDGRHNGEAAPADVYAYQAVLELLDGSTKTVRGEVTLLR